jgi:Rrf2 family iron-sulfur cluster assembly transcriptional regulator
MIRLSRKMQLALEAVVDVAYNARPDPVQSKEITRRQGVPQRYLEQVMQQLVHAGILRGVRGPRGGYRLARERRRITIGDIVRIVAELETSEEAEQESQSDLGEKVIRPVLEEINTEFLARLDSVTIEDLCERAETSNVPRAGGVRQDFTI